MVSAKGRDAAGIVMLVETGVETPASASRDYSLDRRFARVLCS